MIRINKERAVQAAVLGAVLMLPSQAFAFDQAGNTIRSQTCKAFDVAKTVLIAAAVLSLTIGLAPMLWGQVKVKWIISSLVACVLFTLVPTVINAFAGTQGCS